MNPSPIPTNQPSGPAPSSSSRATKILVVLLVLLVITIGYIILRPAPKTTTPAAVAPAAIAPAAVSITATGFSPSTISVAKGQAVVWTNTDNSPHGITASGFSSPHSLSQNDSYSYVFATTGTYTYHDTLNPTTISGTVVVK